MSTNSLVLWHQKQLHVYREDRYQQGSVDVDPNLVFKMTGSFRIEIPELKSLRTFVCGIPCVPRKEGHWVGPREG